MQQKTPLFFSPSFENSNNEKDSPIEQAKKTIDALIAFNKSLMSRFLSVTQAAEIREYALSLYMRREDILPSDKPIFYNQNDFKFLKKGITNQIIQDIKLYEKMKLLFDKADLGHICFSIFYATKVFLANIQREITPESTQTMLSDFLPLDYAKKQTKKIIGYLKTRSSKLPLLIEYNILLDLFNTLTPHLNPTDLKILDIITLTVLETTTLFTLSEYEDKRLARKKTKYLDDYSTNPLLRDLILDFCTLINVEMTCGLNMHDGFIEICTRLQKIYRLETQIDEFIRADVAQIKNAEIVIEAQTPCPSPKKEKPVSPPMEEKNFQLSIAPVETMVTMPEPLIVLETENAMDTKPHTNIEPTVADPVISFDAIVEPLPTLTPQLQETMVETEANEQVEEEPVYFYQPYYKKMENKLQQPQNNTLNLGDDDMDTYLKVVGLLPYETINLRSLVNLTFNFGGEIETTGGNRCRMKIQNIYAFIAVPAEALAKACNSATVTMHGGGHRSTRSQNHDRENAPDYLIEQFKDAFFRAGFTPVNLGLNNVPQQKWSNQGI